MLKLKTRFDHFLSLLHVIIIIQSDSSAIFNACKTPVNGTDNYMDKATLKAKTVIFHLLIDAGCDFKAVKVV